MRHMTLAFLGSAAPSRVLDAITLFPQPPFALGPVGIFDSCLPLPPRQPRLIAWHVDFLQRSDLLASFHRLLVVWLERHGLISAHADRFCPHVTLCRRPKQLADWEQAFTPLPLFIRAITLFSSLGASQYQPLWSYPLIAPFEELDHTADIAFCVRATTLQELYQHAQFGLAFSFPPLLHYLDREGQPDTLEAIVSALNARIAIADQEVGCPYKAVSYHGDVYERNGLLEWEMIVDV